MSQRTPRRQLKNHQQQHLMRLRSRRILCPRSPTIPVHPPSQQQANQLQNNCKASTWINQRITEMLLMKKRRQLRRKTMAKENG
jgi:hypothetical protein